MSDCKCGHCNIRQERVIVKHLVKQTENTITLREGFSLRLPQDFFANYQHQGTVFKLNILHQNGERLVLKWARSSHNCAFSKHVANLITSANMAASYLASFKERVDMGGWNIRVVLPVIPNGPKEIVLEPHITNLEKFNSNTFWECSASKIYQKLIIAFSHFSYVASKGKHVLTNLHGGVDESKRVVSLLPPTVVSAKPGRFGCKDLGFVNKFFKFHTCNPVCKDMPKRSGGKQDKAMKFVVE